MTQDSGHSSIPGEDAARVVAGDPFWSVVRRRHPDLDIVLLPPGEAGDTTAGDTGETDDAVAPEDLEPVDPRPEAERLDHEATRLWELLVGDVAPATAQARWASGAASGTVRRETTLVLDGADPVAAVAAVEGAADTLAAEQWHVFAPPDGMPRVLAGREAAIGRTELTLVHAQSSGGPQGRLVLRVRSGSVPVEDPRSLVQGVDQGVDQ